MTNTINPWINMSPSTQRRIDYESNHNLFWIKDFCGNYGFCLQTENQFSIDENTFRLKGISIIKRKSEGEGELFLILSKKEDWEIFLALCEDLVKLCKKVDTDSDMIAAVEGRLRRWQQLLRIENPQAFTVEKQMGLFSELLCLRDFVAKKGSIDRAITSWVGPYLDKQDFLLDELVIEVKSHRTSKGNFAHISSLQQLNSEKEPLYLFSYSLTLSENGQTVEDVAKSIRRQLELISEEQIDIFDNKLMECGYIPEISRDNLQKYVVDKITVFHVRESFPKISSKDIRSEIVSVKYIIDLSRCSGFEIELQSLF